MNLGESDRLIAILGYVVASQGMRIQEERIEVAKTWLEHFGSGHSLLTLTWGASRGMRMG